jgi:hypothetical protein
MTPDQVNAFERMELLSYGFLPVMLAVRVAVTALVLQLFTILTIRRDHLSGSLPSFAMGVQRRDLRDVHPNAEARSDRAQPHGIGDQRGP